MSDKKNVSIALGYFDSVHIGHKEVLKATFLKAEENKSLPAVFTFKDNLKGKLSGGKCVFTAEERKDIFASLGFEEIFFAPAKEEFLSLSPAGFLERLNEVYDVKAYLFGKDYRFGKNGVGTVETVKEYALKNGSEAITVKDVIAGGEKVSSTRIKKLLKEGKIGEANALLSCDFFITGEVFKDRKIGRTLGFPTVNIRVPEDKTPLKRGVYAGYAFINGKCYAAAINYGSRPTYGLKEILVEAHLTGFNGDLYGKEIRLFFTDFIRESRKFSCEEALKEQLERDVKTVKERVKIREVRGL